MLIYSLMTEIISFTKKPAKSGKGYLIWIPKDIVSILKVDKNTYLNISIKKIENE